MSTTLLESSSLHHTHHGKLTKHATYSFSQHPLCSPFHWKTTWKSTHIMRYELGRKALSIVMTSNPNMLFLVSFTVLSSSCGAMTTWTPPQPCNICTPLPAMLLASSCPLSWSCHLITTSSPSMLCHQPIQLIPAPHHPTLQIFNVFMKP